MSVLVTITGQKPMINPYVSQSATPVVKMCAYTGSPFGSPCFPGEPSLRNEGRRRQLGSKCADEIIEMMQGEQEHQKFFKDWEEL